MDERMDLLGSLAIINNKLARAIPELNSARRPAHARARAAFFEWPPHFPAGITVLFSGNFIVNHSRMKYAFSRALSTAAAAAAAAG